ncbi:hypothetical protein, partial [Burkholderia lata]|uniref:hypothetical protein n=1 Tax=Burkholderia lata (strain ATCC 17760 / DSM 23089 / LMG 22485 / NCIMB 9086 / R18194 / 383) TaxID=482957 RepID=UPI001C2ED24B
MYVPVHPLAEGRAAYRDDAAHDARRTARLAALHGAHAAEAVRAPLVQKPIGRRFAAPSSARMSRGPI